MTRSALTYAWTIIATGTAVLACAAAGWQASHGAGWLVCLGLAALAATFKLKLPKLTGTISPAFVFVLISVTTRIWSETVLIAAVAGIVQCLWRPKTRPGAVQVGFNAAAMAIAGGAAHAVARGLTAAGGENVLMVVLGAAGVVLLVSNTLLISTILCLLKEAPFYTVWRAVQLWAVPYYLAGGVLAGVWARTDLTTSVGLIVLSVSSVYLLSVCYQELGRFLSEAVGREEVVSHQFSVIS